MGLGNFKKSIQSKSIVKAIKLKIQVQAKRTLGKLKNHNIITPRTKISVQLNLVKDGLFGCLKNKKGAIKAVVGNPIRTNKSSKLLRIISSHLGSQSGKAWTINPS